MTGPPLARLLIVDDEEAQMKALCETLHEEGYETIGFNSPLDAVKAIESQRFDLLLTDLMMPEMSGIELLEAALRHDPDLVAIVMTGQGTIETAVRAMKLGALDYVLKPFKLSVVRPVLSRALALRQLRLDKATLELRVRERSAELEAVNQELEAFSYSVSHDLRAPLRHIKSFLQLLQDEAASLSSAGRGLLERTAESAEAMDKLISCLLEFARTSRADIRRKSFSTRKLVDEVVGELDLSAREIRWEIEPLPEVIADPALLKQVWFNLLSNAVKYTIRRKPAVVHIACRHHPEEFEFRVIDNGAGFDMKYVDRLFGVFQRLHEETEFEGTGIGLANVRRIIARHGGRTWAEAKIGEGATFYFTLPRVSSSETV
jgi:signal transduction histidine kinase